MKRQRGIRGRGHAPAATEVRTGSTHRYVEESIHGPRERLCRGAESLRSFYPAAGNLSVQFSVEHVRNTLPERAAGRRPKSEPVAVESCDGTGCRRRSGFRDSGNLLVSHGSGSGGGEPDKALHSAAKSSRIPGIFRTDFGW
jgi:hypothetical protein